MKIAKHQVPQPHLRAAMVTETMTNDSTPDDDNTTWYIGVPIEHTYMFRNNVS